MNTQTIHHLSHEQLCDLILAPSTEKAPLSLEAAEDHLHNCLTCSSERDNLLRSLAVFRHAASSYAEHVYARPVMHRASIAPSPRFRSHVLYWATAAVVAIAVALPLGLHRRHTPAPQRTTAAVTANPQNTPSDEALLDGIDEDLSADVPAAMQPLADPTAGNAASSSAQRKN